MVKVRIAPSPTGDPHVGTAYSALFNWVFARRNNGSFILRIEDTDRTRSTPESEQAIIDSLRWLGLDWDEGPIKGGPSGPYRQSERLEIYGKHVDLLLEKGQAYRCFCTSERLSEMRAKQKAAKQDFGYDGLCRGLDPDEARKMAEAGKPHVVRLRVDKASSTSFDDLLRGRVTFENKTVDDQILMKSDGFPTYHLANVVDDHLMGVTHVIRAEEWISSTPKHIMLYDAFGWDYPVFIHLSLLRNKNGSKISKRKNPVSLLYYKEKGYLPEALLNFLALMGWSTSDEEEFFDLERMVAEMDHGDIHVGGPVFDLDKLDWLNGVHIRSLAPDELADRLLDGFMGGYRRDRDYLLKVIPLIRERINTLSEFVDKAGFFYKNTELQPDSFKKVKLPPGETARLVRSAIPVIESRGLDEAESLENELREQAKACGVKVGQLFMAVRVAVTGKTATPPLIDSMIVLGLEKSLDRMRQAAAYLEGLEQGS